MYWYSKKYTACFWWSHEITQSELCSHEWYMNWWRWSGNCWGNWQGWSALYRSCLCHVSSLCLSQGLLSCLLVMTTLPIFRGSRPRLDGSTVPSFQFVNHFKIYGSGAYLLTSVYNTGGSKRTGAPTLCIEYR